MNPFEFVFGLLIFIAIAIAIMLFGEAFRAHVFLFLGVWLLLPVLSSFIHRLEGFDVKSLRQLRIAFMIFVVTVSWIIFVSWDDVRNYIGHHYFEGYRYWTIETGENDNGEITYGQNWTTQNANGRWILNALQVLSIILAVVSPVVTWKSFKKAIERRQKQEEQLLDARDQPSDKS